MEISDRSDVSTVHSISPNALSFHRAARMRVSIMSSGVEAAVDDQLLELDDHSRAHAAKSPTAQAQFLRPIRGKYSRASHRQRQTAAKLTTFMTGIRRFMKAHAILWQKLYARFSEHAFDQGNRVLVSRVATHLDIRDRVSMKTGRLSQVPNRPIERGPSELVQLSQARSCATVTCDKVTTTFTTSPNQWGIQ